MQKSSFPRHSSPVQRQTSDGSGSEDSSCHISPRKIDHMSAADVVFGGSFGKLNSSFNDSFGGLCPSVDPDDMSWASDQIDEADMEWETNASIRGAKSVKPLISKIDEEDSDWFSEIDTDVKVVFEPKKKVLRKKVKKRPLTDKTTTSEDSLTNSRRGERSTDSLKHKALGSERSLGRSGSEKVLRRVSPPDEQKRNIGMPQKSHSISRILDSPDDVPCSISDSSTRENEAPDNPVIGKKRLEASIRRKRASGVPQKESDYSQRVRKSASSSPSRRAKVPHEHTPGTITPTQKSLPSSSNERSVRTVKKVPSSQNEEADLPSKSRRGTTRQIRSSIKGAPKSREEDPKSSTGRERSVSRSRVRKAIIDSNKTEAAQETPRRCLSRRSRRPNSARSNPTKSPKPEELELDDLWDKPQTSGRRTEDIPLTSDLERFSPSKLGKNYLPTALDNSMSQITLPLFDEKLDVKTDAKPEAKKQSEFESPKKRSADKARRKATLVHHISSARVTPNKGSSNSSLHSEPKTRATLDKHIVRVRKSGSSLPGDMKLFPKTSTGRRERSKSDFPASIAEGASDTGDKKRERRGPTAGRKLRESV